ncbi:AraC family transcriptional regulator [aff. Roholtiella sp. LEGE 12411]|uniref:AraC family transcriptional regulator n=1 Tax=aff. Roholtiella sp. LEGE 12411 TaxID=1828822 RepID=UPI0040403660
MFVSDIYTHLDRDLSLAELAEILNLSPTYFATAFKQATEISPRQYVIQQRVRRAKLMLSKTDLAITLRDSFSTRGCANAYRGHRSTSRLLQPEPFNGTLQAVYWDDPQASSLAT